MPTVKNYLSLIKFSHTIFALPFAMIGFVLGIKTVDEFNKSLLIGKLQLNNFWSFFAIKLLLVLVCMVSARSAAMAFNRYLDRNFDSKNPRTAIREIPSGIIAPNSALRFVIVNCLIFITATFFINDICLYLSPIALLVILFYSYTKRFTALCHLVLGIGLSLAPIGAYLAITGAFSFIPLLFSFAVIFWVSGFDIIYALQDDEFDKAYKLHSIPAALGKKKALKVSELLHFFCTICVIWAGWLGSFSWLYWLGVCIFIAMLVYQHSIVKPNDLSKVNIAFMTANGIASVVFAVFVIADLLILA
ncbi:MAG TPA: UbiA-like polyprenyltransferase [Chitinophagaceae bacterium]|nr:putative 4-hydroxybenzoate polyprenyltransferase [Chitinophagaceae bacterium]MCC6634244.1 UbiA family prenyltransferase [Chitinophagaceae bacterium]HMZ45770.1 UbiA-like polyprenyltransferase [Chitinophagaceae bacterium]HNE93597.1 UbiA-like polyprenyltransferase [Chitinophagaceae bacterium]HNF29387.1 UbiA-like polyprenyltransferase [Chitinophagaceae bacterium]